MDVTDTSGRPLSETIKLGSKSTGFFLVFSFCLSYLILPLFSSAAAAIPPVIIAAIIGIIACYIASGIFLNKAPAPFFPDAGVTLKETFRTLPKLVLILGIFTGVFSAISGLVSVLVFYAITAGIPEPSRRFPVMVCVYVIILLSLPLFIRAVSGFASGDRGFRSLLKSSLRMGAPLYMKFLLIGTAAIILSFLIRLTPLAALGTAGTVITLILTSIILGILTAAAWNIFKRDIERSAGK